MHSPESPSHDPDLRDRAARVVFGLLPPLIVVAFVVLGLSSYTDSVADESEVVGRQVRATGRVEATGATPVPCLIEGGATVLNVVPHGERVRKGDVLARLDTQQQALIMGHAVPMPVVIRTRDYGEELYAALGHAEDGDSADKVQQAKEGLFGN